MILSDARSRAMALRELLAPACERIEVAGSIRRGKPEVKDAEIVAIPWLEEITELALFGPQRSVVHSALWTLVHELVSTPSSGLTRHPPIGDRAAPWGDRYRKLLWDGLPVDLFTATPDTWGAIALIRTGPSAFSKEWVTEIRGFGYRMENGVVVDEVGCLVPVPDEATAFALAGWAYVPAGERKA
jgi:DNA polymerase/3'-5' exonuclease PolX